MARKLCDTLKSPLKIQVEGEAFTTQMKTCPTCSRQYADTNTLCPVDGAVLKNSGQDALLGQVLTGKYRIEEKIDEGGMGCVYRATHVLMEKTLAIKVLHPALAADDKIVARFTREAKAASRISHPHAISVTDFGESENGVVYLVMEYLRGRTLKDIVRSDGPMTLARVTEIVRQVSGALEAAHKEGVVHRDLKSDNIMLEETAGGDWAKVLDFGIAKIQQDVDKTDPGLTAPNLIIGTPQYMSPEQCSQASDIDARSDIYSLGVIVFEMFAGHVPFTGDSPTAIMMKHLQEPPPSVLEDRADLPAEVGRIVERSLAKRPEDRYQSATEFADALAQAASAEASSAAAGAGAALAADTSRIVYPTSPNEPARTTYGDEGEETVVSADFDRSVSEELPPPVAPVPAEPSFNPWRIAVPAIAVLAIVFAVVFAFQRRAPSSPEQPLQTDPNSQPLQSVTPPTGQAEQNLSPSGTPTPGSAGQVVGGGVSGDVNSNANPAATPDPGKKGNENAQPEEQPEEEEEEPEPTPAPRNKPAPNINVNPEPRPTPVKKDEIKPQPEQDKPPQLDDPPPPPAPAVKPAP